MTDNSEYVPPKIWTWDKESGGRFANINRPIAGPTHDKDLPIGKHPLYSVEEVARSDAEHRSGTEASALGILIRRLRGAASG